jgi:hypothetical protein
MSSCRAFPDTRVDHGDNEFYRGWLQQRLLRKRASTIRAVGGWGA